MRSFAFAVLKPDKNMIGYIAYTKMYSVESNLALLFRWNILLYRGLKHKPAVAHHKLEYTTMLFHDVRHALCTKAMALIF